MNRMVKTYEAALRKLAQDAMLLGGVHIAQLSERWRGMAYMLAYVYGKNMREVMHDARKATEMKGREH